MSEIKIGDTVDCSGHLSGSSKCKGGKVFNISFPGGELRVDGGWEDARHEGVFHWVRHDQITRHVPAAPVAERHKSVGDKLASEMTVRERFFLAGYQGIMSRHNCVSIDVTRLVFEVDLIIAALDKELT